MMVAILNSVILDLDTALLELTPCYLLSDSLKNTLTLLWLWLKLIQSDSNSFILTLLYDGSHLEFCHLEFGYLVFSHLSFSFQTHSYLPKLVPTFAQKNFTYLFWLNWMMVAILNSVMLIQTLPSWIWPLVIFSQIHSKTLSLHYDSDSKNSFWITWWWQPSCILPSWILPSYIQAFYTCWIQTPWLSSLRFTQKQSHSNLTLTQTNSIWLKLIYSHLTWWWQPSWILPSWICLSWIQPS